MPRKMNLNLLGEVFTDEKHSDVGAAAFELDHDWFWGGADLVINTAAGGGGTQLTDGVDYQLSVPASESDVEQDLTTRSGKSVYRKVQIINATYQTGDLYFSGEYVADSIDKDDWNIPLLVPQPWLKHMMATTQTALHTGTANVDVSMALKDTTANFSDVSFGDVVRNTASKEFATVLYKSGTDTLYLDADIFPAGTEAYAVYSEPMVSAQAGLGDFVELTGAKLDGDGTKAADTNTLNHLLDADGTVWTGLVAAGDWAMNLQTGKIAKVTAVGAHDLTLQWDAFPNGTEPYMIFAGYVTISDAESPFDGETLTETNVSGRFVGGGLSALRAEDDQFQGHTIGWGGAGSTAAGIYNAQTNSITGGTTYNNAGLGSDGTDGAPRSGDQTRPRTLRATMIVRVK